MGPEKSMLHFTCFSQPDPLGAGEPGGTKPAGISLYSKVRESSSTNTALASKSTLRKQNKTLKYLLCARNCAYLISASQWLYKAGIGVSILSIKEWRLQRVSELPRAIVLVGFCCIANNFIHLSALYNKYFFFQVRMSATIWLI